MKTLYKKTPKKARKCGMILLVITMKSVGIICEYNPFHNGHLYHIEEVKKQFPDYTIIAILSGNVTQRGELSVLSKWEKTELALTFGVDLVVELPFVFASQSADTFCFGAMRLLNYLQVEAIVFGSELGSIEPLMIGAKTQLQENYQILLKEYLKEGINYPTALSKALEKMINIDIRNPNDLLGLGYIKEILKNNYPIKPVTIPRTNNYHDENITGDISSATSIRHCLKENHSIENTVPEIVKQYLTHPIFLSDFFPYLKYKILSEENLDKFETVDERISHMLKEKIINSNSLDEFLNSTKTKYYTYNRLMRMCSHILFSFTKEENQKLQNIFYLRILGFSKDGRNYLSKLKKNVEVPIITNYSNDKENYLELEIRITKILSILKGNQFLEEEIKRKPIIKRDITE